MSLHKNIVVFLGLVFCCFLMLSACSRRPAPVNATPDGIAIKGYDPVAYFALGRPVKGRPELKHDWLGATWLFASREHLEKFAADPEKFAPQYGGYCAYAVSRGTTADIDPEAWTVVDRKLYLNLSPDIQAAWLRDRDTFIRKADENWPSLHR